MATGGHFPWFVTVASNTSTKAPGMCLTEINLSSKVSGVLQCYSINIALHEPGHVQYTQDPRSQVGQNGHYIHKVEPLATKSVLSSHPFQH